MGKPKHVEKLFSRLAAELRISPEYKSPASQTKPYSLGSAASIASIFIPFLLKSACWCQVSHYTSIMWDGRTSLAFPRTSRLQSPLGGLTGLGIGPNLPPVEAGYKSMIRHVWFQGSAGILASCWGRAAGWIGFKEQPWSKGEKTAYRQQTAMGDGKPKIKGEECVPNPGWTSSQDEQHQPFGA